MYTFSPLLPIYPSHVGFYIICGICAFIILSLVLDGFEYFFERVSVAVGLGMFAYFVSFVWSNQEVLHYANVPVNAQFVGFQPEGYNVKSGKSRADRHYLYVIYDVNGEKVILHAGEGLSYPPIAVLYKN